MSVTLEKPDLTGSWIEPKDVELVPESDPRSAFIWINPDRVSGTACFAGTRVPLQILWDHLEEGQSIDDFLEGFPGVSQEQAKAVLQLSLQALLGSLPESTPWR